MYTAAEACERLLASLRPPGEERVPLLVAHGRRLSRPVYRRIPHPPFTRSRVDGFAVLATDLAGEVPPPLSLAVAGVVLAGEAPPAPLAPGAVLRVMAGAALPAGVGAVAPFEEVPQGEKAQPGDQITLGRRPEPGENVIAAGREGAAGSLVAPAGVACGPVELGLLAGAGETEVWVNRRPRVALIATGSELVRPGEALAPGKIYASNLHLLSGLVVAWGGEPRAATPVPDTPAELRQALLSGAAEADLVVLTGGVAGGDRDLSRRVLADLRWPVLVDGVDFHPGGRCIVARVPEGGPPVCLLSGGPGACLTAAAVLVVPALRALGGGGGTTVTTALGAVRDETPSGVPSGRGRRRAVPVQLRLAEGRLWAYPLPHVTGAPVTSPGTDGVILLPPGGGGRGRGPEGPPALKAGDPVEVWPLAPVLPITV